MKKLQSNRVKGLLGFLLLCIAALILAALLGGNQYYISITDSDEAWPEITNIPTKTVTPSIRGAISATAAASQQGDATNSGSSEAQTQ